MEKQFMQRVSRILPSSLASCHFRNVPDVIDSSILISRNSQSKPNNLPDSFNSSIIPAQPKPKPQVSGVSVSNVTKNSSSSNNSGWFSSEQEEEQHQEALIDPETETMYSLSSFSSSFSSSEGSFLNPNSCRETRENQGRSCDHTVMGYAPSVVSDGPGEFSQKTARNRKSSASSCNLYYSDFGSFRREAIQTRRRSGDKVLGCCSFDMSGGGAAESSGEFSRQNTQKSHRQTTKSEPRSEESSEVSSSISTNLGSFRRKTSKNKQRSTKKLSDGEVLSSMSSTLLYYSDFGSFHRKTSKSVRKSSKKMSYGKVGESYAVEKSSRDPYNDFRISMVEMIVEKQIFREEELEKLLECFLSLNSPYHHEIIFKVFLEVCTNLFTQ